MGLCFSDLAGGKQAVGGGLTTPSNGMNDAVHHFLNNRGFGGGLCSSLELSVSASNLLDMDILSKSDPMAVLYLKNRKGTEEEIGRTEVIMNSLNPVWITKFNVIYHFETVQNLVFRIYDIDSKYHNIPLMMLKLNEQDFLGEASCALSEIVTGQNQTITLGLQQKFASSKLHLGTITVRAEETVASKKATKMTFRCSGLKNVDMFSKSDPFLRISRIVETGCCVPVCKTEVINDNLNPVWKPVTLTTQQYGSKACANLCSAIGVPIMSLY